MSLAAAAKASSRPDQTFMEKVQSDWAKNANCGLASYVLTKIAGENVLLNHLTLILTLIGIMSPVFGYAQTVSGLISRIGDTTHLEFRGRKDWNYETPQKKADKLSVILPGFDDRTLVELQSWNCQFIKQVEVNKNAPDGKYEVVFTLTSPDIEYFDYLTDDPSYLIFDFYKPAAKETKAATAQVKPTLANVKKTGNKTGAKLPEKKVASAGRHSNEYTELNRKPAGNETLVVSTPEEIPYSSIQFERGVFDGGDPEYKRFQVRDYEIKEEAIIASQQNIYIRFPMLTERVSRFQHLMKNPPQYEVQPQEKDENKEIRLLLSFFENKKWGSFFETYDYIKKKYPKTEYDEIIKNALAEAHIRLYQRDADAKDFNAFRSVYKYLVETYPDSVLTERNHLLLAYSALDKGDNLEALQWLQRYELKYPNSAENDFVQLAKAEAYLQLNKGNDATALYETLIKGAKDQNRAVEAAYRLGDVQFSQKNYQKALEAYQAPQKQYPQFKSLYPNAQYNISESQFWLGQYKDSLNSYIDFLKTFPSHQHGGFALTRIGELLGILGADQQKSVGAFIEGYFRYPESQGSEVARIRMLSQGLKGMKEREKKRAIDEIDAIAQKSKLPQIQEFVTLMKSDGLSRRGEFKNSLDLLVGYFQDHPTTANLPVFRGRILRNISDVLKEEVKNKNYINALSFYGKYSTTWLKNANRIDTRYYQAVAYEHAGVLSEAQKSFLAIREDLKIITGTKAEKERNVYEHLPTLSQVELRLAAIANEERRYRDAFNHLSAVKNLKTTTEEIERVQIGASVAENMGDIKKAIQHLQKLLADFSAQPELVVKAELHLARLHMRENNLTDVNKHLVKLEETKAKVNQAIGDDDWLKTLELRAEWLLKNNQKLAAVETYTKLLEQFESQYPLSSVRYNAGKILFDEGDLRGAEKIWSQFDEKSGAFYARLAREKLQQAEWQDSYKRYIDRIPAATGLK